MGFIEKEKYFCYVCGEELTEENKSDEHIILNAIGGHLHSYTLLCKKCNSKLGEQADAKLAENLSFFTDMLQVRKNRNKPHKLVMTDRTGLEYVIRDAGTDYELRKPIIYVEKDDVGVKVDITARNMEELSRMLRGQVRLGTLTEEQTNAIMTKASLAEYRPVLNKTISISSEAFPSIIKSAVNFYLDCFHDTDTIKHLIPYVKGEKKCNEVLYLHLFKKLPYCVDNQQVTHMIHLEGHRNTKLLYALMEYFSVYIYVVVLNSDYRGKDINKTYTYDVVSGKEIPRDFTLKLTMEDLEAFRNQPHEEYVKYLSYVQERADKVMAIWDDRQRKNEINAVINEVFANHVSESCFTEAMVNEISDKLVRRIMDRTLNESE